MLRPRFIYVDGSDDSMQAVGAYPQIRGSQIFYATSGEGEPLLLLRGGFGTVEGFASQTPELGKHFRVVPFERPGHGHAADDEEPFNYATMSGSGSEAAAYVCSTSYLVLNRAYGPPWSYGQNPTWACAR